MQPLAGAPRAPTFALAISHTPWVEERAGSIVRLRAALGVETDALPKGLGYFQVFADKAPNAVWSEQMWRWASETSATHCVFLQDDAVVAPDFWGHLRDLVLARPRDILGLQVAHPVAGVLAEEGYQWFSTADALVGVGYVVPRDVLREFLVWRAGLNSGALEPGGLTEDTMLGLYAMVSGRHVFHPIPTIVDHDVSLASTFGNDSHENRRSRVRWDNYVPPVEVTPRAESIHVGRFYLATPALAQHWVPNVTPEQLRTWNADNGQTPMRQLGYARKARGVRAPVRMFIATPTRGRVSGQYAMSVVRLLRDEEIELVESYEITDAQQWSADVVRMRSYFVAHFLFQTDATHLLFLDDDIEVLPKAIKGMLRAEKDFVACPYPKREGVDWTRIKEAPPGTNPEVPAYRYSCRIKDDFTVSPAGLVDVEAMPLGCALLSRAALQKMWDHYHDDLYFFGGHPHTQAPLEAVALFGLMFATDTEGQRGLLSEDYSFCLRYRAIGGHVWMYLGEGSPVNHQGEMTYRGHLEAFGLRRA